MANERKHGVSLDVARTVFNDPQMLTVADLEHGFAEERWFSIGWASNGAILSISYLWFESGPGTTNIRLISARRASQSEMQSYRQNA